MKPFYKTVGSRGEAVYIEKRSRFIATVWPVSQEAEALELIGAMRSEHYSAAHNVYAYIIGENNIARYSDDGEPSGTAGVPVLEVLRKEALIDLCVVVTRYFGGVLLGAGGLVRAYGHAAKLGIDAGGIVVRTLCDVVEIKCDYTLIGKVQYEVAKRGYNTADAKYDYHVRTKVYVPVEETKLFIEQLCDATNARVTCQVLESKYIDLQ